MSENFAFTICTVSYIGLAKVLEKSITKYNSDIDFYIFLIDENNDNKTIPSNCYFIKDMNLFSNKQWVELSFKYTVTEFCTCLKPYIFNWIFQNKNYNYGCYFDPDLFFYDSTDCIFKILKKYLICLTPHFVTFPENEQSKKFEDEIRSAGLYNLGFLGLQKHSKTTKMLEWWGHNLIDKGFDDPRKFQFTDQKWMDFTSIFFDTSELYITKNLGWNVAPWNYFERKVFIKNNEIMIQNRNGVESDKLLFVHYSGYDYKKLLNHEKIQKNKGHEQDYDDVQIILDKYEKALLQDKEEFLSYLNVNYTYGLYSNGTNIEKAHRTLFKSLLINNFSKMLDNPFDSEGIFYKTLKHNKLISHNSNINYKINIQKEDKTYVINKLRKINKLMRIIYKLLGYDKYLILLRFLRRYSAIENQIFLLDNNFISWE